MPAGIHLPQGPCMSESVLSGLYIEKIWMKWLFHIRIMYVENKRFWRSKKNLTFITLNFPDRICQIFVLSNRGVGDGWAIATQVLAGQLTLSQPEGTECAPHIILLSHPALGSFLRPSSYKQNILQKSSTNIKTICSTYFLPLPSLGSSAGGCVGLHVYKVVGTWEGGGGNRPLRFWQE